MTRAWASFVVLLGIVTGVLAIVTGLGFYPIGVTVLLVIAFSPVTAASVQKNRDTLPVIRRSCRRRDSRSGSPGQH